MKIKRHKNCENCGEDNEYVFDDIQELTYDHIYLTDGFSISKGITEDGKEYKPKRRHACHQFGNNDCPIPDENEYHE